MNETAGASGAEGREGDSASIEAVTRVNAEQAPKRLMQEPTRPGPPCHAKRTWNSLAHVTRLNHRHHQRSDSVSDA